MELDSKIDPTICIPLLKFSANIIIKELSKKNINVDPLDQLIYQNSQGSYMLSEKYIALQQRFDREFGIVPPKDMRLLINLTNSLKELKNSISPDPEFKRSVENKSFSSYPRLDVSSYPRLSVPFDSELDVPEIDNYNLTVSFETKLGKETHIVPVPNSQFVTRGHENEYHQSGSYNSRTTRLWPTSRPDITTIDRAITAYRNSLIVGIYNHVPDYTNNGLSNILNTNYKDQIELLANYQRSIYNISKINDDEKRILNDSLNSNNKSSNVPLQKKICSNLEKHIFSNELNIKYITDICSICQDSYKEKETITKLPCGHIYHENCISIWFNTNSKCPICNRDLNKKVI